MREKRSAIRDRTTRLLTVAFAGTVVMALVVGLGVASASGWFTAQHELNQSGQTGTVGLGWENAYNTTSNTYVNCQAEGAGPGTGMSFLNTSNLGPGDYCIATGVLTNTGSLSLTLGASTMSSSYNGTCFWFANNIGQNLPYFAVGATVGPALNGHSYTFGNNTVVLAPGDTYKLVVGVGVWADSPSGCAGQTGTFSINVFGESTSGNGP